MDAPIALECLAALAQETRLALYRLLVQVGPSGLTAGEVAARLAVAPTTLSFHLRSLVGAGLLDMAQEGRFVRYRARMETMQALIGFLTEACCQGAPGGCGDFAVACPPGGSSTIQSLSRRSTMTEDRVRHVLFLCTGNSARSILAEGLLNALGQGRFIAHSAGSHPTGQVHPQALALLREKGLAVEALRSKSWDELATPGAPPLDFIFTVCDAAAGEVCPVWPGRPLTAHWGIPDPAKVDGSPEQQRKAFFRTFAELERRISLLVHLPLEKLDTLSLQRQLDGIGRMDQEARS